MTGVFTDNERQIVANMQDEYRVGVYIVTPAFRAGLACGIKRALEAAQKADGHRVALAAIEALLDA